VRRPLLEALPGVESVPTSLRRTALGPALSSSQIRQHGLDLVALITLGSEASTRALGSRVDRRQNRGIETQSSVRIGEVGAAGVCR
jgi:hypothetical protein